MNAHMTQAAIGCLKSLSYILVAIAAVVSVSGCGGGGGSGASDVAVTNSTGSTGAPAPAQTGTVDIVVKDALGAPVAGARVSLYSGAGRSLLIADAGGKLTLDGVPSGTVRAYGDDGDEFVGHATGFSGDASLPANGRIQLTITVRPSAYPSIGVAGASVPAGGVSADGRMLRFELQLIYVGSDGAIGQGGIVDGLSVGGCIPETSNDTPRVQADCVVGPEGFDAAYGFLGGYSLAEPARSPEPYSATLLVDQSSHIVTNDPWRVRLFDLKYFLTTKGANDRVVLAAFASNDVASGDLSPLPQQPVTIFPVENPKFTTSAGDLFPTIDSLASLEGGAAPLYAAIDAAIDFTAANSSTGGRRAVVVLTDGRDDTCGSPTQCETARKALIEKSRTAGVPIVTLGLARPSGPANAKALSLLATDSGGTALWADDPTQLGILFRALTHVLDGSALIETVRLTIQSPTDGAFQSGRTVLGTAHYEACDLGDCTSIDVPFAVRIP